jgi:hypothetical protein
MPVRGIFYSATIPLFEKTKNSLYEILVVSRVGIQKAKSNNCSNGFTKLICTVASEKYRFRPFEPIAFEIFRLSIVL